MMKAAILTKYGSPNALQVKNDVPKPVPKPDEVLIRIHATSVTASDALIRGLTSQSLPMRCLLQTIFGFGKPRNPILGMVLSGEIAESSSGDGGSSSWNKGDKVFAYGSISATNRRFGSYAEYICLPWKGWNLLPKPTNLTHLEAASIPYGGFLAMHVLDKASIQKGQSVLIYGASGSIGTMAIQLAKHQGATVTAICSTRNFDLVQSLGADHMIDYTKETEALAQLETQKYDVVVDAVGNSKTSAVKTATKKVTKKYISIDDDVPSTAPEAFGRLQQLSQEGVLTPVIDKTFSLDQIAQAHEYVDGGHKRGNVVIAVTDKAEVK